MKEAFERTRVVPVLVFDDPDTAVPTARALVAGGLNVLEVTLRTEAAWAALKAVAADCPDAVVGVGTVLQPEQIAEARSNGAVFAVSPDFDPDIAAAARAQDMFYLPGAATATEVMTARRHGFRFLKFFPAEAAGGAAVLKSYASPFRDVVFCPTGGVGPGNLSGYLALPNVACVGGSWVATAQDMANGDWSAIAAKANAARNAG